jgi:hypothetical protein
MGKSSLMVRAARRLRDRGIASAVIDLTAIGQNLTAEQWYDGLNLRMGSQLRLEDPLEDFWQDNLRLGPCQRWFAGLRQCVIPRIAQRNERRLANDRGSEPLVVIFIDELDSVRSLPFSTDEFFAAVREIYHGRAQEPELSSVAFCLLGVAAPHELMKDPKRTPFSLGQRIELVDFSPLEAETFAAGLAQAYGDASASKLLERVLHWTNGHPYLTQRLCRGLVERRSGTASVDEFSKVDAICEELFLSGKAGESDDNLVFVRERLLRTHTDLALLLDLYERVLRGEAVRYDPDSALISELELAGVVRLTRNSLAVRNRIYERVFDSRWVAARKPIAELEWPDGRRFRLKGTCSLGRTDGNDMVLPDIKVSRRHALIQTQGAQGTHELWVVDLGSRNGTFLNGSRVVRPTLLRDKDQLELGPYRLTFHQPNAPRAFEAHVTTSERTVIR